jgi:hypothetical protein
MQPPDPNRFDNDEKWLDAVDPEVLRRRRERIALIVGGIVVLALAAVLAWSLRPPKMPDNWVLMAAEGAVRREIISRGSLFFSPPGDTQVTSTGQNQFLVRGWVMQVADDGRSWAFLYYGTVDLDANRGVATVHDLSILPEY